MLKTGIYVDAENISRSGGYGMQYDVLRRIASRGSGEILRANSYLAVDHERMGGNGRMREKILSYHDRLRKFGFKLVQKKVQKFVNESGEITCKANADMDLAIDVLLQSDNLDRIVLVTGDGDFVRLVTALQNKGCCVEVIGFSNVSRELAESADRYYSGYLIPGLLLSADREQLHRGTLSKYFPDRNFGFLRTYEFNQCNELEEKDVWFHISNARGDTGGIIPQEEGRGFTLQRNIYDFRFRQSSRYENEFEACDISLSVENVRI